jgi:hypothetical protein
MKPDDRSRPDPRCGKKILENDFAIAGVCHVDPAMDQIKARSHLVMQLDRHASIIEGKTVGGMVG